MSERANYRRTLLTAGVAGVASAAIVAGEASGQSAPVMNDPDVVREVTAEFAGYDQALGKNDVAAPNNYFFDSPGTVRFGISEILFGSSEIRAFRSASAGLGGVPKREHTVINSYGRDFAMVATLSHPRAPGKITRTMQTWVRLSQGWRIVAAHVSTIDEPVRP